MKREIESRVSGEQYKWMDKNTSVKYNKRLKTVLKSVYIQEAKQSRNNTNV